MKEMYFGNYVLRKMDVEEYNKAYSTDAYKDFCEDVLEIAWFEVHDAQGEVVGISDCNLLVCKEGYKVEARGRCFEVAFEEGIKYLLAIEMFN